MITFSEHIVASSGVTLTEVTLRTLGTIGAAAYILSQQLVLGGPLRGAFFEHRASWWKYGSVAPRGQRLAADFFRNEGDVVVLLGDRCGLVGEQLPGRTLVLGGINFSGRGAG